MNEQKRKHEAKVSEQEKKQNIEGFELTRTRGLRKFLKVGFISSTIITFCRTDPGGAQSFPPDIPRTSYELGRILAGRVGFAEGPGLPLDRPPKGGTNSSIDNRREPMPALAAVPLPLEAAPVQSP